jgi:hypothetical protein
MSDRVLFLVVLPDGVVIDDSVFGTTWRVNGGPAECELALPQPPEDRHPEWLFPGWPLGRPSLYGADQALAWFEKDHEEDDLEDFWGTGTQGYSDSHRITKAWLNRAVAATAPEVSQHEWKEFVNTIGRFIDGWVERVTEWLEVLALIDVRPHRETPSNWDQYVYPIPVRVGPDGTLREVIPLTQPPVIGVDSPASSLNHWTSAVAHANAGAMPPDEHRFLRDARAAIRRRDPRNAVIDAATATEIALARSIRTRMTENASAEEIEQVLGKMRGLMPLRDHLFTIGGACSVTRNDVRECLAAKRNLAAHAGHPPTWDEAQEAVAVATTLVNAESPIT